MKHATISLVLALFASPAIAKTVALWPLNADSSGALDGRCAINPVNDLAFPSGVLPDNGAPAWSLPLNPDAGGHVFTPYNNRAVMSTAKLSENGANGVAYATASSDALFNALSCTTSDFTIEGWIRLDELPADGEYVVISESVAGGSRELWTIRRKNGSYSFQCYQQGQQTTSSSYNRDYVLYEIGTDASPYYGAWHHVALERSGTATGSPRLTMFLDGVALGEGVSVFPIVETTTDTTGIYIGGRTNRRTKGSFCYWRVSDEALSTVDFLCSSGAGGQTYDMQDGKGTVAYWPLRKMADGLLNCTNCAGGAEMFAGFGYGNADLRWYDMTLERGVSAFKGQPQNVNIAIPTTGDRGSHVANGNQDSFGAFRYPTFGRVYNLGQTNRADPHSSSFSLEVYYRPEVREIAHAILTDESVAAFWTSMDMGTTTNGWALQVVRSVDGLAGGRSFWRLIFMDSASIVGDTSSYVAYGDFVGGSFKEGDGIWRHVALTFDKTAGVGGHGRWALYVDGAACGTVDNMRDPEAKTNGDHIYLGGNGTLPGQVYGCFDCIAYSQGAAISPSSFLCAVDGATANTYLKALLPLDADSLNDTQPFGCCVLDNIYFYLLPFGYNSRNYHPVATADGPSVSNPDVLFDEEDAVGSALFRNGSEGKYATIETRDSRVTGLFADGSKDMTIEGYFKRNSAIGSGWEIIAMAYANGDKTSKLFLTWRSGNIIYLTDAASGKTGDNKFNQDKPLCDCTDSWMHLAFVRKGGAWSLYTNGTHVATIAKGTLTTTDISSVYFGGRNADQNTWNGAMSELRISKGALSPDDFLCATAQTWNLAPSDADGTLAFWYLDNEEGAASLANATIAGGGFSFSGSASGSASGVSRGSRHADDSGLFDDSARLNAGSVLVAAPLTAESLGAYLDVTSSFTVEGWVKRTSAEGISGEEVLFGTWDGMKGWYLALVPGEGGKLAFKIKAKSIFNSYVSEVFGGVVDSLADWTHIALVYHSGEWLLRVNDRSLGVVENVVDALFGSYGANDFALGSDSFVGAFDLWRVSRGMRNAYKSPEGGFKVLYKAKTGLSVFVR